MSPIISIAAVTKKYGSGLTALDAVDLEIDEGRDFRAARTQRGRQDDADRRRLRHRFDDLRAGLVAGHDIVRDYRAARSKVGLVPQEIALDIFSTRLEHGPLQPRPVRPPPGRPLPRSAAARPLAVGEARQPRHRTFRRDEKARDDRQGAQPRARRAVSGRADRRRRRQPAARHVGAGPQTAREGRHHHSDDALYRGGRRDGRSRRRHQRRPPRARRGKGGADAQARQAAADAHAAQADAGAAGRAGGMAAGARRRAGGGSPTASTPTRRAPAFPCCCAASARLGVDFKDLDTSTSTLEDIFVSLVGRAA